MVKEVQTDVPEPLARYRDATGSEAGITPSSKFYAQLRCRSGS